MNLFNVQTAKSFNDFLERLRAAQNPKEHGTANPVFCVFTRKPIYGVDYHNSPDLVLGTDQSNIPRGYYTTIKFVKSDLWNIMDKIGYVNGEDKDGYKNGRLIR